MSRSNLKIMFVVFFYNFGGIHHEFMSHDQQRVLSTSLKALREEVCQKSAETRPWCCIMTTCHVSHLYLLVTIWPLQKWLSFLYSPHLTPIDFFLFPVLKTAVYRQDKIKFTKTTAYHLRKRSKEHTNSGRNDGNSVLQVGEVL